MVSKKLEAEIEVPGEIKVQIGELISFEGPRGKVERKFNYPGCDIKLNDGKIKLTIKGSKKEKAVVNAYKAHILNAFNGVIDGYVYKLKICSGHFPMTVGVQNNMLTIKNFLGEKVPRTINLNPDVKVKVEGDIIVVEGPDKEIVGQVAANIEKRTKRPGYDKRIFQDGIYIISKGGKEI